MDKMASPTPWKLGDPIPDALPSGLLPSRTACSSTLKRDLQRLCYQTTSRNQYRGRGLTADDHSENMQDLFYVGHQRNSKYLNYRCMQAPIPDRDACSYTQSYYQRTCDTWATDMAENIKLKQRHKLGAGNGLNATTRYTDEFCRPTSPERMKRARGIDCKPEERSHAQKGLAVTRSHSQRVHIGRPASAPERARPPRSSIGPHNPGYVTIAPATTHYQHTFTHPSEFVAILGAAVATSGQDSDTRDAPARRPPLRRASSAPNTGRRPLPPRARQPNVGQLPVDTVPSRETRVLLRPRSAV